MCPSWDILVLVHPYTPARFSGMKTATKNRDYSMLFFFIKTLSTVLIGERFEEEYLWDER